MPANNPLLNDDVLINGCRIATGVHGSGRPLVLVHGTPAHSVIWQSLVPVFVDAGFHVHLYDLAGFGASERPLTADTSVAAQVGYLIKLLEHWQLEKTDLFGHDIGGAISLRLAFDNPSLLKTLTIADIPSYDSWPSPTWKDMRDHYADYALIPATEHYRAMCRQLKMAVFNKDRMTEQRLDSYLAPLCGVVGQPSFYQHQVAHYNECYTSGFAEKLPQLRLPVQILWGAEDEWQPVEYARRLQRDIVSSTLHIFEQAGHFLMEDAPLPVAAQVIDFVNQHNMR
ncbi:alpha/beta fold hydrolase [Pantoea sp. 18059]|uniref:alpha/beta fold hydrolase n=1 Tax=Pantoea sp. 18059 TaxID=2681407 RepID=UPI001F47EBB1|nr:alpha/beta hydrolase [Pantoea sp. 18059]